ncbi:rhomboid family intramembrane serine protease [Niastella caeni]|uniref:Rhomboid family intramembrane serine protease n=2 Tax=Niastella caeni TaxID=2569763 RepID=A0A4S8HS42_9BACT|nr:rhomboid family intramembrane serine protease [Niastella caeni]
MRGFGAIPPVIKNLVIINVLVWLAELTFGDQLINLFALQYYKSPDFRVWQLITHMFLHGSWGHIIMNMFVLWMFGTTLEEVWGSKRFLVFYMICGLGAAIIQLGALAVEMNILMDKFSAGQMAEAEFAARARSIYGWGAVGASGAINGVMVGFAYLFPNAPLFIFPLPVPVKAKYVVIGYFLLDLFGGINPRYGDNVAHFAHVGGAIVGLILVMTMNKTNRRTFY